MKGNSNYSHKVDKRKRPHWRGDPTDRFLRHVQQVTDTDGEETVTPESSGPAIPNPYSSPRHRLVANE